MSKILLVSYDITNNKLRRKVEKILCNYGLRLQYSVFRCSLSPDKAEEMRAVLADILIAYDTLVEKTDSLVIIGGFSLPNMDFLTRAIA